MMVVAVWLLADFPWALLAAGGGTLAAGLSVERWAHAGEHDRKTLALQINHRHDP